MRYFTPELYLRFNSSDDAIADRADVEWSNALDAYRAHLEQVLKGAPASVQVLSGLDLHDAEWIRFDVPEEDGAGSRQPGIAVAFLKQDDSFRAMIYRLAGTPTEKPASEDWPFSSKRVDWLYDEIDIAAGHRPAYLHRILLSDGRIMEIPFASVTVHHLSPPSLARQSA